MFEYMKPKDGPVFEGLESLEIVYAKDQPEYLPLRTLKSTSPMGPVLSRWTFTEEQRKAIAEGADVILELTTFHQPLQPIRMAVTSGKLNTDWVRVCLLDMHAEKPVADDTVVRPEPGTVVTENVE